MSAGGQRHALLTPAQMALADRLAIEGGIAGVALMEAAGRAVADAVMDRWSATTVCVLCGPGNNGGDGFVAACRLREAGWPVRIALLGRLEDLGGDAALCAQAWGGPIEALGPAALDGAGLVIDALLGAGLSRPLAGAPLAMVEAANRSGLPVCAVDVPSGLDGATGRALGAAVRADVTVTFFRRKPGHLLMPGRALCGELLCADIGIPDAVLDAVQPDCRANHPDLWIGHYPWASLESHKYRRGHLLVVGGDTMLGATRLASQAAARMGAGLVTLAVPPAAWPIQAGALTSVMVACLPENGALGEALADERRNVVLIGPGLGVSMRTRAQTLAVLSTRRPCVLDADAISSFAGAPDLLVEALHEACVLTPHEGEFARLFPGLEGDKLSRARAAARACGAVMVLKGADTVIARPDGQAVINDNAPPELATGGTGDVLAGCIAGLLAQGMRPFEAACAAVYLHGQAAAGFGPGLIAQDLPDELPGVLAALRARSRAED
ncbi:NAD(P)H-hydrate dehydratase [Castellaniella sp. S9]|uniref:NAD(P)H-hydrate dehydratase n=1 Tax=Castellaniella sp. S9 TaxID=2993652 RepID=UPI0022B5C2D6|nr:NAD(P)H-hydrate dehydratase [Castellaniella sp. S9]